MWQLPSWDPGSQGTTTCMITTLITVPQNHPHAGHGPRLHHAGLRRGLLLLPDPVLIHEERAAERYGVPAYRILEEISKAGYVGGQEDMIVDFAVQLAGQR